LAELREERVGFLMKNEKQRRKDDSDQSYSSP